MSSVVLETWTQVKTTKKKKNNKHNKSSSPHNSKNSFPRARFDFGEQPSEKVSKNNDDENVDDVKTPDVNEPIQQLSWSSVVKTGKAPHSSLLEESEKNTKFTVYLYDHEVDELAHTMKWGDFEVMTDDVVVVPYGVSKPEESHL